jgi:hypothetical protein
MIPGISEKSPMICGKPPHHTRFKPGQSGNAQGRRKKAKPKSFLGILDRAFDETVRVTENGRPRLITKREALAKQLSNKAAAGDLRAAKILLELIEAIDRVRGSATDDLSHERTGARERLTRKLNEIHARLIASGRIPHDDDAPAEPRG